MHFWVSAARPGVKGHLVWPRKMGTNWFMPALVNSRLGLSGMRLEDGTMVCCFDLKKSRNDWRICELVIIVKLRGEISPKPPGKAGWKFISCRITLPVSEAEGGNGPVWY